MSLLLDAVMASQGLSENVARREIDDARQELYERLAEPDASDLHDFCMERWGLEPDFLPDLLLP